MSYDAVRLLVDRVRAVRPGFDITDDDVPAVSAICRALDGMPLAIELAAARLRTMTVVQLASRLDDRFRLLTGGNRTAMTRHQTLRAVVDWSWELLSEAEQALLRRVTVFAGGVTVEAAERVCAGGPVQTSEVLDLLTALADKSLLMAEGDDEAPRYRMLETIRAYGRERLDEAGERDAMRHAYARFSSSSPRPRSRTYAVPNSWSGDVASRRSTTTCMPRCVARSRSATRSWPYAWSTPLAGTGGSAVTRRRGFSWPPRLWKCQGRSMPRPGRRALR
jgi:hypothetical protein